MLSRSLLVAAAALLWAAPAPAARGGGDAEPAALFERALAARLSAIETTEGILKEKIDSRRERLRARLRVLYQLSRAGRARLWVEPRERAAVPRRRAALRRLLRREVGELSLLRDELAVAGRARERLERERSEPRPRAPERGALYRPIVEGKVARPFGRYRDRESGARLVSRGIELAAHPGRNARALERGTVRWTGELGGIGRVVVVDHELGGHAFTSVLGRLRAPEVEAGEPVERGQKLGEAAGDRVYLEIRLPLGPAGFPIDPEPLLSGR